MVEKATDILKIQLKDVRLSFPALFKAKPFGGSDAGEPAFSAEFLIPKDTKLGQKLIDQIDEAIEEAKYAKWGDNPDKWPKISRDKPFFKDGDDRDYRRDETEGMMICSARNLKKPRVLGIDKEDIFEADGIIYGGCYVDAIVRVWAQDNKYGKRINCSLEAVRFRRDGDPFGAAPINPDEFEDIEDDGRSRRGRTIEGTARRVSRDDDDRGDDRGSRRLALEDRRGRDDDDDRGSSRGRGRDDDEDRGSRRGRDDDDRGSRRGKDDDDAGERGSRRGADRDDDTDRGSRRGRDDSEDRGRDRGRDADDDRGTSRSRSRDDDDDRGSRRSRDDDRDSERDRGRGRDDDGDRGTRRSRDDDEDRPSRNSRSSGRRRGEDDDI